MKTIFLLYVLLLVQGVSCFTTDGEVLLREDVFTRRKYDVNVRPQGRVNVEVLFNLLAINQLDIKGQRFQASGWLTLVWNDERLSWNNTGFGNIRFLFATQADVWRPALIVSNSIQNLGVIQDAYTPFRITDRGRVVWEPTGIFDVYCDVDISYYPFDQQECHIVIQSWGYNLMEVNVTALQSGINLNEYRPNGEWDIIENRTVWTDSDDAKGDEYAQLRFYFKLNRKSEYYWLNVLLPIIVNSILTALVFALPAESGEKMGYSLTVLLSFAVLLTLVADKIPSTSTTTCIIVVYFAVVLILAALAVFLSTIVLKLYFHDENDPIPDWMKWLFGLLAQILCYGGCKKRHNSVKDFSAAPNNKVCDHPMKSLTKDPGATLPTLIAEPVKQDLSWKDVSKILDVFFLRFYCVVIMLMSMGFLLAAAMHA